MSLPRWRRPPGREQAPRSRPVHRRSGTRPTPLTTCHLPSAICHSESSECPSGWTFSQMIDELRQRARRKGAVLVWSAVIHEQGVVDDDAPAGEADAPLTLPMAKARGFSLQRHTPPSEVLQCLLERSLLRGGSRVPHGTYLHPGRLATCQVVQVDGLVLATLGPRSWLMFYEETFSPQRPTSSCQKANRTVPKIRIGYNDVD